MPTTRTSSSPASPLLSSTTRPPPPPTRFPYTTLFRSARSRRQLHRGSGEDQCRLHALVPKAPAFRPGEVHDHSHQSQSRVRAVRSEEHSLNSSHLVISYAVFCLKKKKRAVVQASSDAYDTHIIVPGLSSPLLHDPPPTPAYPLSLHDALPICSQSATTSSWERRGSVPPSRARPESSGFPPWGSSRSFPPESKPCASRKIGRAQSELQSPCNLVCRLLLEKKKTSCRTGEQRCLRHAHHRPRPLLSSPPRPAPHPRLPAFPTRRSSDLLAVGDNFIVGAERISAAFTRSSRKLRLSALGKFTIIPTRVKAVCEP